MVVDPETPKPCKRQVFLFEQLMIFSEPFERKLDWTVYIYRNSIKVIERAPFHSKKWIKSFPSPPLSRIVSSYFTVDSYPDKFENKTFLVSMGDCVLILLLSRYHFRILSFSVS